MAVMYSCEKYLNLKLVMRKQTSPNCRILCKTTCLHLTNLSSCERQTGRKEGRKEGGREGKKEGRKKGRRGERERGKEGGRKGGRGYATGI